MALKNPPMNLYKKIVFTFIGFTIILLVLIFYLSFSRAKIIIVPQTETISADLIIDVAENPQTEGVLKGRIIETEVEGDETFSPTGGEEVPSVAGGTVTIYNRYNKNQPLVRTTRLLTPDGKLFRLKETVNAPAGGEVQVKVYADEKGKDYEIGPSRFIIPGLWEGLQDKIFAESFEPMKGGARVTKIISEDDILKGRDSLEERLYNKGITELENTLRPGENINKNLIFKEILESAADVVAGEEVNEFTISIKLKTTAVLVDESELLRLAETKMKNSISADKKLVNVKSGSLSYNLEKYDLESGIANLKVYLEGETVIKDTSLIFSKDNLVGRSKKEAEAYLESFDAIREATVNFSPFWVTKVPSLKDHIRIEIK